MDIRENIFYEGSPHIGGLVINILLGFAVICLPLTVGSVVRAIWLLYCITNHQISITDGRMRYDYTDTVYDEITKMVKIPQGTIGLWNDIAVTLQDKSRLELRAVPDFRKAYDYMAEKTETETPVRAIISR
ncbi:hypothetical protein RGRSB_1682 [cyanobacterium endosymbiont of Rhopalodia gibberula]|uniref:PH domain-containing protein n=1 Tax=cyanobacterium endosymbiont of Rhopalodia gibberula TaxID=1763363 RepID=UPI000DC6F965|nr:PH domain-containing protein [cyanobacterium endosymbiont of Rhopalodia gibberula]BBA80080.1 hypothetical protein RGRSB_1682 [cyanobacterium endosymbiont of Rhopalodia gibberula]